MIESNVNGLRRSVGYRKKSTPVISRVMTKHNAIIPYGISSGSDTYGITVKIRIQTKKWVNSRKYCLDII